jgi:hypothetical protein
MNTVSKKRNEIDILIVTAKFTMFFHIFYLNHWYLSNFNYEFIFSFIYYFIGYFSAHLRIFE